MSTVEQNVNDLKEFGQMWIDIAGQLKGLQKTNSDLRIEKAELERGRDDLVETLTERDSELFELQQRNDNQRRIIESQERRLDAYHEALCMATFERKL